MHQTNTLLFVVMSVLLHGCSSAPVRAPLPVVIVEAPGYSNFGNVRLGMTVKEVEELLGYPNSVALRTSGAKYDYLYGVVTFRESVVREFMRRPDYGNGVQAPAPGRPHRFRWDANNKSHIILDPRYVAFRRIRLGMSIDEVEQLTGSGPRSVKESSRGTLLYSYGFGRVRILNNRVVAYTPTVTNIEHYKHMWETLGGSYDQ